VIVFDSSMPTSQIQATVDTIASKQVSNQFGTDRYALLFKPGTYGSSSDPLNFQVGYYTSIAGLGRSPGDVVINGSVYVHNQCDGSFCTALNNFWRSLSNLTINVTTPNFGCYNGEFWAVSQAAPMRRVDVNGFATLMDYCTQPSFASGGFIADSRFSDTIVNGSQQQWLARNSALGNWTNGVWNQVFSGVVGAPAECFPAQASCGGPYTTLPSSSVTREAPYLYVDSGGNQNVFVPSAQSGSSERPGPAAKRLAPRSRSTVLRRKPFDSAATINSALRTGRNLILTPVSTPRPEHLVTRPDTVVLGLGFPTLIPTNGNAAMTTARAKGILISGVMFDAGPGQLAGAAPSRKRSRTERQRVVRSSTLSDVFFRIGGATPGSATTEPRRQQQQRHPRRHLGLAGRPRQRRRLDEQHRRHRRDRQRRQRDRRTASSSSTTRSTRRSGTATAARSSSSRTRCPTTRRTRPRGWRRRASTAGPPSRSVTP
jgi:hypothetical protein